MNVAAEKLLRLVLLDEIADCCGSAVQARLDLVERRSVRRRMADQHQRIKGGERLQACGEFGLAVLARSVERRGARIAESGEMVAAGQELPLVEVVPT